MCIVFISFSSVGLYQNIAVWLKPKRQNRFHDLFLLLMPIDLFLIQFSSWSNDCWWLIVLRYRVILSLFLLMGISWTTEIISLAVGGLAYIWIPTDILNFSTSIFIFVTFVCKKKVLNLLTKRFEGLNRMVSYIRQTRDNMRSSFASDSESTRVSKAVSDNSTVTPV